MTIFRTWRPSVAGTAVLAIALVAGVTGWQIAQDSGDGGESARNATVAEQTDAGDQNREAEALEDEDDSTAETGNGEPATNRSGTERSRTGDSTGGSDAENLIDISELAGEGEDYGPTEGAEDPGSGDDLIAYMPELDWTDLSRHFRDELDCPSGRRTSTGDCFVFDPEYEPRFVPGDAPRPDEAGSGF